MTMWCPNCTLPHDDGVDGTAWCRSCVDDVLLEQKLEDSRVEHPQVFSV